MIKKIREETVKDFNQQWEMLGELTEDYLNSDIMLLDYFSDLFNLEDIKDKIVGDVGAGYGRALRVFLKYNPKKIYAIEPSDRGSEKISTNFKKYSNLSVIKSYGHNFKTDQLCDVIFSLGVLHHIKEPKDVLVNIKSNLKPNGKIVIWVYGYENNFSYILIYKALSIITKKLPNFLLNFISVLLNFMLIPYILLCKYFNLPLKTYLINVFSKCGLNKRKEIIFDQLNPTYAKYYKKDEIRKELTEAGFVNLKFYHRHGYSWTVSGENLIV